MNLLVFLSDRCDMSCDYCFLSLNRGPATVLDADAARRACADHLARCGRGARVNILGGEPLIHWDLARGLAAFILKEDSTAGVTVFTNGTGAHPGRVAELLDLGARVTVSLDGEPAAHDAHRKLAGRADSAAERTWEALAGSDAGALRANMVVSADTAAGLVANVEHLRRKGFRRVSINLDARRAWTPEELAVLAAAFDGLVRYVRTVSPPGRAPALEIANAAAVASARADRDAEGLSHGYEDLVLGADARYYACDSFLSLPYAQAARWAVGDVERGVDWGGRERLHAEARSFIHAHLPRPRHYNCPRETYFLARLAGRDPAPAVRGFMAADELLGRAMSALCEAHAPA